MHNRNPSFGAAARAARRGAALSRLALSRLALSRLALSRLALSRLTLSGLTLSGLTLSRLAVSSLALSSVTVVLAGCGGSAPAPPPQVRPTERTETFLIDPLLGYPLAPAAALEQRVRAAARALRAGGTPADALTEAEALLEVDPGFHPASVLLAQALLVEGRAGEAFERLQAAAAELPDYEAAQRVLAVAAEAAGEVVAAYEALSRLPAAGEVEARLAQMRPRLIEVLHNRFDEALARGRVEDAATALERLQRWADDDAATTERAWSLATRVGDEAAERNVLERLLEQAPERRDASLRLAELEIAGGELRRGLARLEALAARDPDDAELAALVERAKFRWRLETFPPEVRALASKPELDRAELAALVYWLVPDVRHAPLENPPVATDILDHPRREEIVRVLDAALMEIDSAVHRFAPDAPAIRGDVIAAVLRLAATGGPPPACLDGVEPRRLRPTARLSCETAVHCGLLDDLADCLPAAPVSGDQALELFRLSFAARASRPGLP